MIQTQVAVAGAVKSEIVVAGGCFELYSKDVLQIQAVAASLGVPRAIDLY